MSTFVYRGEDARVYPALGLAVQPGDEAELDAAPDHRWAPKHPRKSDTPTPAKES